MTIGGARWGASMRNVLRQKKIYELLKKAGHSPVKAYEILLDATRGDEWACLWIKTLFQARR